MQIKNRLCPQSRKPTADRQTEGVPALTQLPFLWVQKVMNNQSQMETAVQEIGTGCRVQTASVGRWSQLLSEEVTLEQRLEGHEAAGLGKRGRHMQRP